MLSEFPDMDPGAARLMIQDLIIQHYAHIRLPQIQCSRNKALQSLTELDFKGDKAICSRLAKEMEKEGVVLDPLSGQLSYSNWARDPIAMKGNLDAIGNALIKVGNQQLALNRPKSKVSDFGMGM